MTDEHSTEKNELAPIASETRGAGQLRLPPAMSADADVAARSVSP